MLSGGEVCGGADGLSVMVPADEAAGRDAGGGGVGKCQSFLWSQTRHIA